MYSHIVIFWTDPANPKAADEVIAGAEKYLKPIPGITHFQIGKMAASPREVVDQTYQVGVSVTFTDKKAHDDYQAHPDHLKYVAEYVRPLVKKLVIYDFA